MQIVNEYTDMWKIIRNNYVMQGMDNNSFYLSAQLLKVAAEYNMLRLLSVTFQNINH